MKTCTQCNKEKNLDCFYKRKQAKDGLEAFCKDCRKKRNAKWFAGNKERHNQMMVDWYNKNKDRHLENNKQWYEQNKDKKLATVTAREQRCKQATPSWADIKKIQIVYAKAKALSEQTGIKHEVDHIIPLCNKSVCGLNVHYNLQVLTQAENRRKSNKLPQVDSWGGQQ